MRSPRVICSRWVRRRRGRRSMSWETGILIGSRSIRRPVTCIGARSGRMQTMIVLRPAGRAAMTRSTRRGRPETLAGHCSWLTTTPIASLTMRRGRAGQPSIRRSRSMIPVIIRGCGNCRLHSRRSSGIHTVLRMIFRKLARGDAMRWRGRVYPDLFPDSTRLPEYYNGKLIIYEWMRSWMKAVTMLPNGDFDKMEPFAPGVKMNSVIDMEVGPGWERFICSNMVPVGLPRIRMRGWRGSTISRGTGRQVVSGVSVDRTSGLLPFTVKLKAIASDPEKGKMTYEWDLGNGEKKETIEPELDYTYKNVGCSRSR